MLRESSCSEMENLSASFSFSLRELSFSSIWTVQPRYARLNNCPISENERSLAENETSAFRFSTSEQLLSSSMELLFKVACLVTVSIFKHQEQFHIRCKIYNHYNYVIKKRMNVAMKMNLAHLKVQEKYILCSKATGK